MSSTSGISAGALGQELHLFILINKQAVTIKRETCPNCPAAHGRCQQNSEQNMIYKTKRKNPEQVCSKNTFPVLQAWPFRCFRVVYKTLPHILCYGTLYPEYDTSLLDFQVLEHSWYSRFTRERAVTAQQQQSLEIILDLLVFRDASLNSPLWECRILENEVRKLSMLTW